MMRSQYLGVRERLDDDSGTSMMELIVGMALMVVFMGMFTGAMLLMSNTVNKVEAVSATSGQLSTAFLQLDREVRYANAIGSAAGDATSGWHVEFARVVVDPSTSPATQSNVCTQLRLFNGVLAQRTWKVDSTSAPISGSGVGWATLGSGLNQTSNPFIQSNQSATGLDQLQLVLVSTGTGVNVASRSTSTGTNVTFTALNSASDLGAAVCPGVGPQDPTP